MNRELDRLEKILQWWIEDAQMSAAYARDGMDGKGAVIAEVREQTLEDVLEAVRDMKAGK
jgi:hypothetical protein